jgi:hypothetical protein
MPTLKVLPEVESNPEKAFLCQKAGFLSQKKLSFAMSAELTFTP